MSSGKCLFTKGIPTRPRVYALVNAPISIFPILGALYIVRWILLIRDALNTESSLRCDLKYLQIVLK